MHEYIYCSISNLMGRMITRIYHADVNHNEYIHSLEDLESNTILIEYVCAQMTHYYPLLSFKLDKSRDHDEDWWCFSPSRDWSRWRIYFSGQWLFVADVHVLVDLLLLIIMGLVRMTHVFPRGSGQWYWSVGSKALGSKKRTTDTSFWPLLQWKYICAYACSYILCVRLFEFVFLFGSYQIIVADAADAVSVNFSGRCKFLQI